MDIKFVKDGIEKIKKKPIIAFIIIAVFIGIFFIFKNRSSDTTSTSAGETGYTTGDESPTGSVTGTSAGAYQAETLSAASSMDEAQANKFQTMFDKLSESNQQQYESLDTTIAGQNEALMDYITKTNEKVNEKIDTSINKTDEHITDIESKIGDKSQTQPIPSRNIAANSFTDQIAAYAKIKDLGTQYETAKKQFVEGGISESEKTSLEAIHQEAEKTGIAAGFGAGGESGASRVVPKAVQNAYTLGTPSKPIQQSVTPGTTPIKVLPSKIAETKKFFKG